MPENAGDVSCLLGELRAGVADAEERLLRIVYGELKKIAASHLRRDRSEHTLQATALVNEAYLRLTHSQLGNLSDRSHFFALSSRVMRRILIDYARQKKAAKRGGGNAGLVLDDNLGATFHKAEEYLALDQALTKLATWDERQAQIVEMRFFGGLGEEEVAEVLGISPRQVRRDWVMARAWLHSQMSS